MLVDMEAEEQEEDVHSSQDPDGTLNLDGAAASSPAPSPAAAGATRGNGEATSLPAQPPKPGRNAKKRPTGAAAGVAISSGHHSARENSRGRGDSGGAAATSSAAPAKKGRLTNLTAEEARKEKERKAYDEDYVDGSIKVRNAIDAWIEHTEGTVSPLRYLRPSNITLRPVRLRLTFTRRLEPPRSLRFSLCKNVGCIPSHPSHGFILTRRNLSNLITRNCISMYNSNCDRSSNHSNISRTTLTSWQPNTSGGWMSLTTGIAPGLTRCCNHRAFIQRVRI